MANWSLPSISDLYADVISLFKARDTDLAKGLDPANVTVTNPEANFIRWTSASSMWEKYNGTSWGALAATYAINVDKVDGYDAGTGANNILVLDGTGKVPSGNLPTTVNALESLVSYGLVAKTGAGTVAARTLTAPAAGVTVSNGDGVLGNPTLALANDLAAIEGLASTGFAARTGSDAWAQRSLAAPAAGFTITNPAGIAGNPTFALSDDLAALEGLASTGIAVRTAANTWAQRSVDAGTGMSVTNGNGVSGNPTVAISDALLVALVSLVTAADKGLYFTASDTPATFTLTAAGRALLDDADASAQLTTLGISTFIKTLLDDADASTALSTLGVSTYAKTLLDDASAGATLTTLGVSAFIQTLLDDASASAALTTLGVSSFAQTLLDDTTAAAFRTTAGAAADASSQTIWIPAGAIKPRPTGGPVANTITLGTNNTVITSLDFDPATIEYAQFKVRMPKGWDKGALSVEFEWTHAATTTNFKTAWAIRAKAEGNGDSSDSAWSSAVQGNGTGGTTNNRYRTAASSTLTPAGGPFSDGDLVVFEVYRNATDATNDTMAIDARLEGVTIIYGTTSLNDA